jgi:hypothetical protein
MIAGYQIEVSTEFPITKPFSFEIGLLLSKKGTKQTYAKMNTEVEGKFELLLITDWTTMFLYIWTVLKLTLHITRTV